MNYVLAVIVLGVFLMMALAGWLGRENFDD